MPCHGLRIVWRPDPAALKEHGSVRCSNSDSRSSSFLIPAQCLTKILHHAIPSVVKNTDLVHSYGRATIAGSSIPLHSLIEILRNTNAPEIELPNVPHCVARASL